MPLAAPQGICLASAEVTAYEEEQERVSCIDGEMTIGRIARYAY